MTADERHDIARFSIFKKFSEGKRCSEEARNILFFWKKIQEFMQVNDVDYGPDPPDFVIKTAQTTIGAELTELNPKVFSTGGYRRKKIFREWQEETKQCPTKLHKFSWGEYTVRESLAAFEEQLTKKAKRISSLEKLFDEYWLIFHLNSGCPAGAVLEINFTCCPQEKESVLDFAGKYLYEMAQLCKRQHPFTQVMLSSKMQLLSFPSAVNTHGLPFPNDALLERGAKASDKFLDWKLSLSSVRRSWDESQGDLDTWLKSPPEKIFKEND